MNHYLIQNNDGTYATSKKKLIPMMMENHLNGTYAVGTFAGVVYTKFFCFDVDYEDLQIAKWITYKITHQLDNVGIFDYYISFSGRKGYHIDIFIEDLIPFETARKFFRYVINAANIEEQNGQVEFRPTDKQGVKLPLGVHQITKSYCGFCKVEDGLKVMSKLESQNYLFQIKKIKRKNILNVLEEIEINKSSPHKKKIIQTEDVISKHKNLDIYDATEDNNIEDTIDLLTNGLKISGSRHTTTVKIAKYLKYTGLDQEESIAVLNQWMDWQDKKYYNTPLDECNKEIIRICKWVYSNDSPVKQVEKNITITLSEIDAIIHSCPEKNQKLLIYAMLIHSKRYATMKGIFFMSYDQMAEATGISKPTVKRQVKKLAELNVIEIVDRNRKQKDTHIKLPNKYKITLNIDNNVVDEVSYTTDKSDDIYECMLTYYTTDELKMLVPRKQYNSIVGNSNQ
jgi:DNA-binding transcriptional ArsR family regulator